MRPAAGPAALAVNPSALIPLNSSSVPGVGSANQPHPAASGLIRIVFAAGSARPSIIAGKGATSKWTRRNASTTVELIPAAASRSKRPGNAASSADWLKGAAPELASEAAPLARKGEPDPRQLPAIGLQVPTP